MLYICKHLEINISYHIPNNNSNSKSNSKKYKINSAAFFLSLLSFFRFVSDCFVCCVCFAIESQLSDVQTGTATGRGGNGREGKGVYGERLH